MVSLTRVHKPTSTYVNTHAKVTRVVAIQWPRYKTSPNLSAKAKPEGCSQSGSGQRKDKNAEAAGPLWCSEAPAQDRVLGNPGVSPGPSGPGSALRAHQGAILPPPGPGGMTLVKEVDPLCLRALILK